MAGGIAGLLESLAMVVLVAAGGYVNVVHLPSMFSGVLLVVGALLLAGCCALYGPEALGSYWRGSVARRAYCSSTSPGTRGSGRTCLRCCLMWPNRRWTRPGQLRADASSRELSADTRALDPETEGEFRGLGYIR